MKHSTRILIDDNSQRANQEISELRTMAHQATELIASYNRMPVVGPIELAVDAREFLQNPVAFLDESILNNCGIGFSGKHKPDPAALAAMYRIPYSAIVARSQGVRLSPDKLALLVFDEGSHEVIVTPEAEDQIREKVKIWLSDPEEIAEYTRLKTVCDTLEQLCADYSLSALDKNQVPKALPFIKCVTNGQGWILKPAIERMRKHLNKQ